MVDHQDSHLSDQNATSQVPPSVDATADADRMPRRIIDAVDGIGL